jgi:hypothetical protein
MASKASIRKNPAVESYLAGLRGNDVLVKLDWEQWLQIDAPYRDGPFTTREVTTRFKRNGYDWIMHGRVYTPKREVNAKLAFFVMHGSGDNENNMDMTPDGRPGFARVLAAQGFKVLSVSYPGHYPPGGAWKRPRAPRQPVYLYDKKISPRETIDRNYKATVFVTLQGAGKLIDRTLAGRKVLAFGQATSGGMVAHLQPFTKRCRIVGLPGFGSGGPDGWKRQWADTLGAYGEGNPIDTVLRRGVEFFVDAGYQDAADLCPWGGPEEYMAWADKFSSQLKPALTDNQYNGCFKELEQVVARTGLPRAEYFGHFEDPDAKWLTTVNVLLVTGEKDPGHWVKGGDDPERKREIFMARKYQAAGCKRVHVVVAPRYGHLGYAELHNEKFVYLWLWAQRDGYFG